MEQLLKQLEQQKIDADQQWEKFLMEHSRPMTEDEKKTHRQGVRQGTMTDRILELTYPEAVDLQTLTDIKNNAFNNFYRMIEASTQL